MIRYRLDLSVAQDPVIAVRNVGHALELVIDIPDVQASVHLPRGIAEQLIHELSQALASMRVTVPQSGGSRDYPQMGDYSPQSGEKN